MLERRRPGSRRKEDAMSWLFAALVMPNPSGSFRLYLVNDSPVSYSNVMCRTGTFGRDNGTAVTASRCRELGPLGHHAVVLLEETPADGLDAPIWYEIDLYRETGGGPPDPFAFSLPKGGYRPMAPRRLPVLDEYGWVVPLNYRTGEPRKTPTPVGTDTGIATAPGFEPLSLMDENRTLADAGSRLLFGESLRELFVRLYERGPGMSVALFGVLATAGALLDGRHAEAAAGWATVLHELRLFVASRTGPDDAKEPPADDGTTEKDLRWPGAARHLETMDVEGLDVDASLARYVEAVRSELARAYPGVSVEAHWEPDGPGKVSMDLSASWMDAPTEESRWTFLRAVNRTLEEVRRAGTWTVPAARRRAARRRRGPRCDSVAPSETPCTAELPFDEGRPT
jgi:hypothetical protein